MFYRAEQCCMLAQFDTHDTEHNFQTHIADACVCVCRGGVTCYH